MLALPRRTAVRSLLSLDWTLVLKSHTYKIALSPNDLAPANIVKIIER
jgi:hypothetical protein